MSVEEWIATLLDGSVGALIVVVGAFLAARYAMRLERRADARDRLREAISAARRGARLPIPRDPQEALDWVSTLRIDLRALALEWAQQDRRLEEAWVTNATQAITWAYIEDAGAPRERLEADPLSSKHPHDWARMRAVSHKLAQALEFAQMQPSDEHAWVYSSVGSMNQASGHFPETNGSQEANQPGPN